jgi:hypothetical protein
MSLHLHLQDTDVAVSAAAPLSSDAPDLSVEIAALENLDIHGLRLRWRRLFRKPAPSPSPLSAPADYRLPHPGQRLGRP